MLGFYLYYRWRERPALAVHEAGHALVAWASDRVYRVDEATLGRFFGSGGYVMHWTIVPDQLYTEADYVSSITVSLAGMAADQVMGTDRRWLLTCRADRKNAVKTAERLVRYRCRHQGRPFPPKRQRWRGYRLSSEALEIIARCSRTAEGHLARNRGFLVKLARALLAHNTLDTGQLADILGPKGPPPR